MIINGKHPNVIYFIQNSFNLLSGHQQGYRAIYNNNAYVYSEVVGEWVLGLYNTKELDQLEKDGVIRKIPNIPKFIPYFNYKTCKC